ncbi:MAG: FAD-dependent oxidoreductase [Acidobacteria bacterium]|nr:FAD-dependent oxidoreductase [Acidobacteriota bacterium]
MPLSPSSVTVVGAGVAGLTLASQLAPHRPVTVVEALDTVGGLARSWHYGDFHFDVGPHRFHTEQPRVSAFIREVLGDHALEIRRKSGVRMFGRFHEWPLRPTVLLSMPPSIMMRAARDLFFRSHLDGESFEADIVNKYGRTLSSIFFDPYTRKFLFHSPAELHRDWARAGVNRAVIDQRASADSLWGLVKTTFLPKPVETTFLYPSDGVGRFSERLADRICGHGGHIALGRAVTRIDAEADRITAIWTDGERQACQNLIWTGTLSAINRLLGIRDVTLRYLSTIFYNIELDAPLRHDYQWIYYGGDEIFSRVSAPAAFSPATAPAGKSGLCVELTCLDGDERWQDPERYTQAVVRDLVRTGTIARAEDVARVHIEPVRDTYPIYTLDYLGELQRNFAHLARYKNLLLAGRSARFWYNNMDHSIGQGLTMADKILKGTMLNAIDDRAERAFWDAPAADALAVAHMNINI